jgi:hypothetical protein
MTDAADFLRRRRQQMQENPGLSTRALNKIYCQQNQLPTFNKQYGGVIKQATFTKAEQKKQEMDDDFQKTVLWNKIQSCGESQIGRNAAAGKHGIIMKADDDEIVEELPKFGSVMEQARYMHQKNREKRISEDANNQTLNTALGSHILHQLVDQKSIGGVAIEEASRSRDLKDVTDTKTDLKKGHEQMYQSTDYKIIKSIRKMRTFDQSDEQELSHQHESALGQHLETEACTMASQELGRD